MTAASMRRESACCSSSGIMPAIHVSKHIKTWLCKQNQTARNVAQTWKTGVRIIPCWSPAKSPWLNKIEPKWIHGKRAIVEPARGMQVTPF